MASEIFCDTCGAANQPGQHFCFACGKPLTPDNTSQRPAYVATGPLAAGLLLKQRYRILRVIGSGGMGAVYAAEDTELGDRLVAIKEMSQQKLSAQGITDAAENFKREAHMLARLQNPNLPSIHDYFTEGGRWYLVMEFIPGETLQKYLAQHGGKLPVAEALQIGLVLCRVLDYLHSQPSPIIFRDLKPSNIMRTPEGEIYLIDFGIARHFKPGQARDTAAFGSAGYAAPEQYGHSQTTPRSDIYSLGGVLYQMLSGRSPAQTPFNQPALQTLNPQLPPELVKLVERMISLDEKKRPATMREIKQELEQVAASLPRATIGTRMPASVAASNQQPLVLPPTLPAPHPASPGYASQTVSAGRFSLAALPAFFQQQLQHVAGLGKSWRRSVAPAAQQSPAHTQRPQAPAGAQRQQVIAAQQPDRWAQFPLPAFLRRKRVPTGKLVQAPYFSSPWSGRMLSTVVLGTLLCALLILWLDHGTFPTWYLFTVATVPFRISLFLVLDMLTLVLALYFGVVWGPWAGLCVGGVGTLLGDYIGYAGGHFGWNWDIRVALAGLLVGLFLRRAMGRPNISQGYIYSRSALALLLGTAFASYSDLWLHHETFGVATIIFLVYSALSLGSCLLLSLLGRVILSVRQRLQTAP